MSKSITGTQTEKNLLKAFAGESQARNRYTFFASKAKKEGLMQIADIFQETANQEKEHGERFFKFLEGGSVEITESFPAGIIGTTLDNLKAAAAGEAYEWSDMYPAFAEVARKEGFKQIAAAFEAISVAEKHMKNASKILPLILRPEKYSKEMAKWCGAAVIAVTCMKPKKHRRPAPPVCILRPILSYSVKTGKPCVKMLKTGC